MGAWRWSCLLALSLFLLACPSPSSAAIESHRIRSLPGWTPSTPAHNFTAYAGNLGLQDAQGKQFFYYFVESQRSPQTDPLVLWLNGGPGCSSLSGLFSELGPYWPTSGGKSLQANDEGTWNRKANVLFLESPIGVGFSYAHDTSVYRTGDAQTADDSYLFLVRWFRAFPEYRSRPFYVSGESYAGHYVPDLVKAIIEGNRVAPVEDRINLQGFLIGNAYTDAVIDGWGVYEMLYSYSIISNETYQGILQHCNIGPPHASQYFSVSLRSNVEAMEARAPNSRCDEFEERAEKEMGNINPYEVYEDVCPDAGSNQVHALLKALSQRSSAHRVLFRSLQNSLHSRSVSSEHQGGVEQSPCIDNDVIAYLNRADVQAAIHAPKLPYQWDECTDRVKYSLTDMDRSMLPTYLWIFQEAPHLRILIFSGSVDSVVPFPGTRAWLSLLPLQEQKPYTPWTFEGQVGGRSVEYDHNFRFTTIRNAGHMCPGTQPSRTQHMYESFLDGSPF